MTLPLIAKSVNFLVLPSGKKSVTVVLNHYKTSGNKEDAIIRILSSKVSTLVTSYLKRQNLTYNDWLFGQQLNSRFVTATSLKIGIKGGISYLRKAVNSERAPNMAPIERSELAQKMGHSSATALTSVRPMA